MSPVDFTRELKQFCNQADQRLQQIRLTIDRLVSTRNAKLRMSAWKQILGLVRLMRRVWLLVDHFQGHVSDHSSSSPSP